MERQKTQTYLHTSLCRIANLSHASRNVFCSLSRLNFNLFDAARHEHGQKSAFQGNRKFKTHLWLTFFERERKKPSTDILDHQRRRKEGNFKGGPRVKHASSAENGQTDQRSHCCLQMHLVDPISVRNCSAPSVRCIFLTQCEGGEAKQSRKTRVLETCQRITQQPSQRSRLSEAILIVWYIFIFVIFRDGAI